MRPVVAVEGLNGAIKALKAADMGDVTKVVNTRWAEIGTRRVQQKWRTQRIRPSQADKIVRPIRQARTGGVKLRYKRDGRFGFVGGVEFGSSAFKQFRPWVGNRHTGSRMGFKGYVMFPTLEAMMPEVEEALVSEYMEEFRRRLKENPQ